MSVRPLVSNIIPEFTPSADGVQNLEMSVNPLSTILISLKPLNDTGTLANFVDYFTAAKAINRATLSFRGQSLLSMKGEDIVAYNYLRWGILPPGANENRTDNERRAFVIPVHLGRVPFDPSSCFPATTRGLLTLSLDLDIADTGYDSLNVAVDAIELIGAKPKEFERRVELSRTNTATGNNDLDLIPGNVLRNLMMFGTTDFTGATPAPSLQSARLLVDGLEAFYAGSNWEVLQALPYLFGRQFTQAYHYHGTTVDGNAGTSVITVGTPFGDNFLSHYAMMDLDVTRDDAFSLDLSAARKVQLRHYAGTADAVRVIQTDVMKAADFSV